MSDDLSRVFDFMNRLDDYEERKVDRYEDDKLMISTARVFDSDLDFETAVQHPAYNEGMIVIVEGYATREEAACGHQRWVKTMTAEQLPTTLEDVSTYCLAKLSRAVAGPLVSERGKGS